MTSYKQAIDAFVASEEFETSSDPTTIQAPEKMRRYIENRLHRAFMAGWTAREAVEVRVTGHTGNPSSEHKP